MAATPKGRQIPLASQDCLPLSETKLPSMETTPKPAIALLQTENDIKDVCREVANLLIEKNRSYGNSALHPVRIFSKADATEAIRVRIDDKLSRLRSGNGEAFKEDTLLDLLGYLVLLRIAEKRARE